MKKNTLEKLELYGTVRIKINEKAFATLSFNKNKISFFIYENELFSKLLKSFGLSIKNLTMLGNISEKLNRIGIGLSISDQKGLIIKLGAGSYNPLVKARVNIKRLAEFI
ncbi:MAG: hypothetical protein ACP5FU_04005 [Nitrososphaeria archaeon]|nr:hypothetical protein [Conexivisphaerales archaeon]